MNKYSFLNTLMICDTAFVLFESELLLIGFVILQLQICGESYWASFPGILFMP